MASRFDPSAFIEAEKREHSQALAAPASNIGDFGTAPKAAEIRHSAPSQTKALATIATLAASGDAHAIWTGARAMMEALPRPLGMKAANWNQLVRLVSWTAEDWGQAAYNAGWDSLEFFGCNPDPFVGRSDRDGLVMTMFRLSSPVELVAVHTDHVALTDRSGSVMRYRPFGPRGQVYLWEAYAPKGGP